jgi:serine/threonine protein phosphatase PrpC
MAAERSPAGWRSARLADPAAEKWGFKVNQREARELFKRITQYLQEIDKTLTEQSEADHRLWGMGTTVTAAYSIGVDLFIIHLGDSRAYLYRGSTLQQLTKDHTVAQAMADAGYIAPEAVRHHAKRNGDQLPGGTTGKSRPTSAGSAWPTATACCCAARA